MLNDNNGPDINVSAPGVYMRTAPFTPYSVLDDYPGLRDAVDATINNSVFEVETLVDKEVVSHLKHDFDKEQLSEKIGMEQFAEALLRSGNEAVRTTLLSEAASPYVKVRQRTIMLTESDIKDLACKVATIVRKNVIQTKVTSKGKTTSL